MMITKILEFFGQPGQWLIRQFDEPDRIVLSNLVLACVVVWTMVLVSASIDRILNSWKDGPR